MTTARSPPAVRGRPARWLRSFTLLGEGSDLGAAELEERFPPAERSGAFAPRP